MRVTNTSLTGIFAPHPRRSALGTSPNLSASRLYQPARGMTSPVLSVTAGQVLVFPVDARTRAAYRRRGGGSTPARTVELRPEEQAPNVDQATLSPAQTRLEEQIVWYDVRSRQNQHSFKALKICQIVIAAAIPVAAAASAPLWLIGSGGALIVILEGLQQLQQYQQNWTTYRSTCAAAQARKVSLPQPRLSVCWSFEP